MGKRLMNRCVSFAAFVLIGVLPSFGSSNLQSVSSNNQFHFQQKGSRAEAGHKLDAAGNPNLHRGGQLGTSAPSNQNQTGNSARARLARRHTVNPPTGKIGFVSATQIPAGGGTYRTALAGDFNGDGKKDVVTIVENYVSSIWTYSISTVLSNGDGTFQAPVLTPIAGDDSNAQIVVGDLNGDKKDDIIVAHQNGNGGCISSCFDVLLSNGDGTFTPGTNYSITSNYLAGGTLADVNGDGKLDVVVVDQNSPGNVWTLLGNGDGTFQSPTSVALSGQMGNNVIFADFNGDGLLDVADTDSSSRQVTVYLATSATTYASGVAYTTPDAVYNQCNMTAGDLTGDGKPEIVTANCNSDDISVYVNNGDGTFQTAVYYNGALNATGGTVADVYPEAVTIADVNGDGKADIISSNDDSSDVTILLGNGDGTVRVPTIGYAVAGYPRSPAIVADFNGDGFADILVPDDEFSFVYLKGYGDGTFRSALNYYSPISDNGYAYGIGIATGDFNGDGIPDFVIGNCCDNTVGITVFLSRPDGSMQTGVNYGGGNFYYAAVADFNGDGKLDVAATDVNSGLVQIFNGVGDGTFSIGSTFATDLTSTQPQGLVAGDFNRDGHPDLAIQNSNGQNVGVLINDGTGGFLAPVTYGVSVNYSYEGISTADLNGDGNLDLVVPLTNGSAIAILLGNGDGTFQAETDVTVGLYPGSVAIADLNGDGKLDLAATTRQYGSEGVDVAFGNGDGTFQTPVFYASSLQDFNLDSPYPTFIQAADIDGDGTPDLVYTNSEYGSVGVLFGAGNGVFYDPVEYPSGGYAYGMVVADVNQDGAPDVVTAGDDFSGVTVLLNSNGSATKANYTITAATASATVTAGSSATFTLTITPSNHYNGTVTFSCGLLPSLATCTFNPASVALDGSTPVNVQLTVTTAAVSASLQGPIHGNSTLLASLGTMGLFAMMLAGSLKKRNRGMGVILGMLILTMTFSLVGCGGSSSSPAATVKTATTTTLSSSQSTALVGQSITFTGHVSATSGSPTGTVSFQDGSTALGTGTVSGGVATFQTQTLAAGVHNVIAAYSGDANFDASSSSAMSQTMDRPGTPTGAYSITINATGSAGTNNGNTSVHPFSVNVTVQ
jgi:hypothetical protein